MNNAALILFLSSGMSVPLFAKKVMFPMNVKSPNQNFLVFRLTKIKMKAVLRENPTELPQDNLTLHTTV